MYGANDEIQSLRRTLNVYRVCTLGTIVVLLLSWGKC